MRTSPAILPAALRPRLAAAVFPLVALLCLLPGGARPQGSVLLVGGGSEDYNDWSDRPYRWLVEHAPNRKILILHYATTSTWLPAYFRWLGADSATSLVIPSTAAANDSATYRAVLAADGLFLRGGDQWEYVRLWKETLVEEAIRMVYLRGGAVGGTSAGLAVLTDPAFDARTTSVNPRTALRSPTTAGITFTTGFLGLVPGVLGDTHFFERGRFGRLAPMIALHQMAAGAPTAGAGVDYNTALAVRPDNTAEVMGAGTVTFLRLGPSTTVVAVPGAPFSTREMLLDQLTDGFVVNLSTWEITPPAGASAFTPAQVSLPGARTIVDGSASSTQWYSPSGSLAALLAPLLQGSAVTVIASPAAGPTAASLEAEIARRGHRPLILPLDAAASQRLGAADTISMSSAIVLGGNTEDSLAAWLDAATPAGAAFRASVASGTPVLALGNDGKLLSDAAVGGVESHEYAAYYGMMRHLRGLGLMSGVHVMTRLYESSSFIDNRASGLFWGLADAGQPFGLLLDDGTSVEVLPDGTLRTSGATPAILVDARSATTVAFPAWRDPGRSGPRQNAALVGARLHVIPAGESFRLLEPTDVRLEAAVPPESIASLQSYPNPFNGRTTITLILEARRRCTITVHDVLGREVALLAAEEEFGPGRVTVPWDAAGAASGTYFVRLRTPGSIATISIHLLR
jgi:cyanophycinase